jgi:hypothetical protein
MCAAIPPFCGLLFCIEPAIALFLAALLRLLTVAGLVLPAAASTHALSHLHRPCSLMCLLVPGLCAGQSESCTREARSSHWLTDQLYLYPDKLPKTGSASLPCPVSTLCTLNLDSCAGAHDLQHSQDQLPPGSTALVARIHRTAPPGPAAGGAHGPVGTPSICAPYITIHETSHIRVCSLAS